jgi:hypothetical protein
MRPRVPSLLGAGLLASFAGGETRAQASEAGFRPLFDGESLAGWVTRGGRYDGDARWSVEEGAIVGRPGPHDEGGLLYTERLYTSFVLRLEVKLDHPFDSGLFVRMAPRGRGAQITLDHTDDGEIGAVYSDEFLGHSVRGRELFRRGEWNEVELRCTGFDMRLEFLLNGTLVTDLEVPGGPRPPPSTGAAIEAGAPIDTGGIEAEGFAPIGRIGLQVHGGGGDRGAARFRNLRVRELPVLGEGLFEPAGAEHPDILRPTAAAEAAGWRALFDGASLSGWASSIEGEACAARDGVLAFLARGAGGELCTAEDFRDFRLRLDFKLARMGNSGVFLRAARDGKDAAFSGCEVQILDDFDWERVTGQALFPWQRSGSLYGAVAAPAPSPLRPPGEWNTYEILYRGSRLAVALNGCTLYDLDTLALAPEKGLPFAERAATGFIGLQHHGSEHVDSETTVEFRNLFVQPLAP